MALEAGTLHLTIEYAQGLKDKDFFGKQDPFAQVTIGGQTYRTKTIHGGGKSPVFNETFRFNIINENDFHVTLRDEDVTENEMIGTCRGDLAKARTQRSDRQQLGVQTKSGKQHGTLSVSLKFEPNSDLTKPAHHAPVPYGWAPPGAQPQYGYAPQPYGAPPPGQWGGQPAYGAPQAYPGYPQAYPPQAPGYPPQQAPGYPPQQPPAYYPPQAPGYPPQPGYAPYR